MKPGRRSLARVVTGVLGTALGLRLGASTRGPLGPLDVKAELTLDAAGGMRIDVPPLGVARLPTHRGPLQVRAVATAIDPSRADGLLRMPEDKIDAKDVRARFEQTLTSAGADARQLGRS
ncbi:MAG: hypothetical protein M3Y06_04745, partial [Actinomycetota bacterium]|nr:hypothetical protein [Actinomycetota bacterium]